MRKERRGEQYFVGVFDVDTEAELLENASLRLDHLVLRGDVLLVERQRAERPAFVQYTQYGSNLIIRERVNELPPLAISAKAEWWGCVV